MLAREPSGTAVAPCGVCGNSSWDFEVWGALMCVGCYGAWRSDPRFRPLEVDAAAGVTTETPFQEAIAKSDVEFKRRTREWVAERKKRAA